MQTSTFIPKHTLYTTVSFIRKNLYHIKMTQNELKCQEWAIVMSLVLFCHGSSLKTNAQTLHARKFLRIPSYAKALKYILNHVLKWSSIFMEKGSLNSMGLPRKHAVHSSRLPYKIFLMALQSSFCVIITMILNYWKQFDDIYR